MEGLLENMNPKKYLKNHIRGWLPKEPNLPSNKVKMKSEEMKISTGWKRFLPLLIISCTVLAIVQVILYLLAYIDFSTFFGGVLVMFLTIPLPYAIWHIQTRYQHSKTINLMNKLAFIMGGAFIAFPLTMFAIIFTILATGATEPFSSLGPWLTIILLLVVPMTIGALIGYLVGKRRNYALHVTGAARIHERKEILEEPNSGLASQRTFFANPSKN